MNSESFRLGVASMSLSSVVLNTMLPAPINAILGIVNPFVTHIVFLRQLLSRDSRRKVEASQTTAVGFHGIGRRTLRTSHYPRRECAANASELCLRPSGLFFRQGRAVRADVGGRVLTGELTMLRVGWNHLSVRYAARRIIGVGQPQEG